jgi:dimethylhistidine N-methyltransferase
MKPSTRRDRLALLTTEATASLASFSQAVREGLAEQPKRIPSRFFYDRCGSLLFEEICDVPEYYLTRAERSILEKRADDLAERFSEPVRLVELGSGSAVKTRILIEAFLAHHQALTFVPIDISATMLEQSADTLLDAYPQLRIQAFAGEYETELARLRELTQPPRLILWLGSSLGNLTRREAAAFLGQVRAGMTAADRVLVGIDLRKSRDVLERAYDDARGVTARFNLNLLERINRELGGHFELENFEHRALYREDEGRVEMHLVSRSEQRVAIDELDETVTFRAGEMIHTENSYKYSVDEIGDLATSAGLCSEACWLDADELFSLNLFAAAQP